VSVDVAVVRFHGEGAAVKRYADAKERAGDAPWTHQIGFVERHHNGRLLLRGTFAGHYLDVDESDRVSQKGAAEGAVVGGLVGVLAGPAGIAVGLVLGAVIGEHAGSAPEIEAQPEGLAEQLRDAVPPSSSAIVLIGDSVEVDEMLTALGEGASDVARRGLSDEEAAALESSLSAAPPVQPER
jgi:uncharacterized membrane protein